ncbi:MAG: class I SAM-dependent methyltransferase [Phycisphaerales bacterium]|nr:MAG: class I SAM-dependent methyltransferase [Phycisphaerales bacterium]
MDNSKPVANDVGDLFRKARHYDRSINWPARIAREIPVLMDVLGPPGKGGIVDAGCGVGRQACEMSRRGYRVVGVDLSAEMLQVARGNAEDGSLSVEFLNESYAAMHQAIGGGFDGLYCLGNSLAAAGTRDGVVEAVEQFSRCVRTGGRLFVQVLNSEPIRSDLPTIRGPRVATVDGTEYVSVRHFKFLDGLVQVTNITLWQDDGWHQRSHIGQLYPVSLDELRTFFEQANLRIDNVWGNYDREPYDTIQSDDLVLTATRV